MENLSIDEVLFEEDQQRIVNAVTYYPFGSSQLAEIAELSAKLHQHGIWVSDILKKEIKKRGLE